MRSTRFSLIAAVVGATFGPVAATADAPIPADGRGDVTVVAVVDVGFNPYHWDFRARFMPQQLDEDPANDLPLSDPPHTWIPGFPDPAEGFASYQQLDLTLTEASPYTKVATLDAADAQTWKRARVSTTGSPNYLWFPGTKIVGAISWGDAASLHAPMTDHGVGTSSVSVGNLYGACPECVVVLLQFGDQDLAIRWAMKQPWIDVITNSYGHNLTQVARDNIHLEGPVSELRDVVERGQQVFWSAGNGLENGFVVPAHTMWSSQKGPDWITTVGAIAPNGTSYSGAGKMVDLAGIGSGYPAAYGSTTVTGSGTFSGTSNATPTIAGTYTRALALARTALAGPSKLQEDGVIATGDAISCGSVRPDCELGDGILTSQELRGALYDASVQTSEGMNAGGIGAAEVSPEAEFMSEGRGSWFVRVKKGDTAAWLAEFDRFYGPLIGTRAYPSRPDSEREWFRVDSFCRQQIWGSWSEGVFRRGVTPLPESDTAWPVRTALKHGCQQHPPFPPDRAIGELPVP